MLCGRPRVWPISCRAARDVGEPVAAELSLALVDEAIFSLSEPLSGPIFDAFYHYRVRSADGTT